MENLSDLKAAFLDPANDSQTRDLSRRGLVIGAVALVLSWLSFSVAANERLGLVFAFFMCASLGAALDVFEPRRRFVIAICAAVFLIAALFLAAPIAQPLLTELARSGSGVVQTAVAYESAGDLLGFLEVQDVDLLHFAGHGEEKGGIVLDDGHGGKKIVTFEALGRTFRLFTGGDFQDPHRRGDRCRDDRFRLRLQPGDRRLIGRADSAADPESDSARSCSTISDRCCARGVSAELRDD